MKRFLPAVLTAFFVAPVSAQNLDSGRIYNIIQVQDGKAPAQILKEQPSALETASPKIEGSSQTKETIAQAPVQAVDLPFTLPSLDGTIELPPLDGTFELPATQEQGQFTFAMQGQVPTHFTLNEQMPLQMPVGGQDTFQMPTEVQAPFQLQEQMPFINEAEQKPLFDMETPYRCQGDGFYSDNVSTTIPVNMQEFNLIKTSKSDALPSFEVNGYSFENRPLDEALQYLVDEADILVYTQDNAYPALSAQNIYGDLETVITALTENAGMYYSYDDNKKRLNIMRQADFEISLPNNRFLMFGVLDALRGAGIDNVVPDWNSGLLKLTLTLEEKRTVENLIKSLKENGEMLVANTRVYQTAQGQGQALMQQFGLDKVNAVNNGLVGSLISTRYQPKGADFASLVASSGATLISEGMAVVPNGWRMLFDTTKCMKEGAPATKLAIALEPEMKQGSQIKAGLSLHTNMGEITSYDFQSALDDELAIIGLNEAQMGELLILVKLKLIRLVGDE